MHNFAKFKSFSDSQIITNLRCLPLRGLLYVLRQIGPSKQCRPRLEAGECSTWLESKLFATGPTAFV